MRIHLRALPEQDIRLRAVTHIHRLIRPHSSVVQSVPRREDVLSSVADPVTRHHRVAVVRAEAEAVADRAVVPEA